MPRPTLTRKSALAPQTCPREMAWVMTPATAPSPWIVCSAYASGRFIFNGTDVCAVPLQGLANASSCANPSCAVNQNGIIRIHLRSARSESEQSLGVPSPKQRATPVGDQNPMEKKPGLRSSVSRRRQLHYGLYYFKDLTALTSYSRANDPEGQRTGRCPVQK